jgi:hypothetical protein
VQDACAAFEAADAIEALGTADLEAMAESAQVPECGEQGYLLLPEAERQLASGDVGGAFHTAVRAAELGALCGDQDLMTFAVHLQGMCRVKQG